MAKNDTVEDAPTEAAAETPIEEVAPEVPAEEAPEALPEEAKTEEQDHADNGAAAETPAPTEARRDPAGALIIN